MKTVLNGNRKRHTLDNVLNEEFYQMPKFLFDIKISNDARVLYALLKSRHKLSIKNGWINENNEVYLIFSRDAMQEMLQVSKPTAIKAVNELKKHGLIEEERLGQGLPNRIYLTLPTLIKNPENLGNALKSSSFTSEGKECLPLEVNDFDPIYNNINRSSIDRSTTTTDTDQNHDTIAAEETLEQKKVVVVVDKSLDQPVKKPTADEIKKVQEIARTEGLKLTKRNIEELWKIADGDLEQIENGIKASVQYAKKYEVRNMWGLIKDSVAVGRLPALTPSAQKLEEIRRKEEKYRDVYVS